MAPIGTLGGSAPDLAVTNSLNPGALLAQKNRQEIFLNILVGLDQSFISINTSNPSLYLRWIPDPPQELIGGEADEFFSIQSAFLPENPLPYKESENGITYPGLLPVPGQLFLIVLHQKMLGRLNAELLFNPVSHFTLGFRIPVTTIQLNKNSSIRKGGGGLEDYYCKLVGIIFQQEGQ